MALNTLGVLDLSAVTDELIRLLNNDINHWPLWAPAGGTPAEDLNRVSKFTINVTGAAPDTVRSLGECQLSLYLFHVAANPYLRNSPVAGQRAQTIQAQPLSLDLYYVLSAFAADNYHQEQQAMSIAMRCLHQNPILRVTVQIPVTPPPAPLTPEKEEFTLTLEVESVDSLSRLWQSVTSAMRLAAIYKVSVVFITPPAPAELAAPVQQFNLVIDPATLPLAANGQLIGAYRRVVYSPPTISAARPKQTSYDSAAPSIAPGQTLLLFGGGLSDGAGHPNPTAKRLFLIDAHGIETEITSWLAAGAAILDSRLTIVAPVAAPPAGVYQLAVGSDVALGDATTYRSNAVPIAIAPAVTGLPLPPTPPILASGTFTGAGFVSGKTEILLETVALVEGQPKPGNFQVANDAKINFQPPTGLSNGLYALRVRVNKVEADPSWWVSI